MCPDRPVRLRSLSGSRPLPSGPAGPDWMKLWRPRTRPWQGESLIINAVAAMPMPRRKQDLSFAGMRLPVERGGSTDFIEVRWTGLTGAGPERRSAGREAHAGREAEPARLAASPGTSRSCGKG